jgi:surface antigen
MITRAARKCRREPALIALLLALIATALTLINATPAAAGTDDYPAQWAYPHPKNSVIDSWGEYNRECTSFVAWRLHSRNGFEMPFHDNASGWAADAQSRGYAVNTIPAVGSVAYWTGGNHVAWVEGVNANGTINVEEYNVNNDGLYHEELSRSISGLQFIHFKDLPTSWSGVTSATFLGSDKLQAGGQLGLNQYLLSPDARFALILQNDGNLVLYSGSAIWQSGTAGSGATHLTMQMDGNLVLYTPSNTPVWQSFTGGTGHAHMVVQSDGNVVIYSDSSGTPTWWTATGGHAGTTAFGSDTLAAGQQLNASSQQYLRSSDGRYGLLMQSDGTVVLYGPGYHVLWSHHNDGAARLAMQADGNLVLYNGNSALWWTGTAGTGTNRAVLQTDGNFVTYTSSNAPTWWTGTGGQQ